jgi:tetratricopeptide (TPR) repeat protein
MRIILALAVVYLLAAYSHALQTTQGIIAVGALTLVVFFVARLPEILLREGLNCQSRGLHAEAIKRFGYGIAIGESVLGAEHAALAGLHEAMAKSYSALCQPLRAAASARQAKSIRCELGQHKPFSGAPDVSQSLGGAHATFAHSWIYRFECAHMIGLIAVLVLPAIVSVARNINVLHLSSAARRTILVQADDDQIAGVGGYVSEQGDLDARLRNRAEELYLNGKYSAAAKLLKKHVQSNSFDAKGQLDLGKTFIALGQIEQAISPLSSARCLIRSRLMELEYEKGSLESASHSGYDSYKRYPVCVAGADLLTQEQCRALDVEARRYLETAVLAVGGKIYMPESEAVRLYKNDRPFSVMQAALKLAQRFHKEAANDRLDGMYQLAEENAVNYPSDVVVACSVQEKSRQEIWDKVARMALNARTHSEEKWAQRLLVQASLALPATDLRRAAGFHYVCNGEFLHSLWGKEYEDYLRRSLGLGWALSECDIALDDTRKSLHLANCSYDLACSQFEDGTTDAGAEYFQKALELYESNQVPSMATPLDLADTHYNLGMALYATGKLEQARIQFREALRLYDQLGQQLVEASPDRYADRWAVSGGRRACEFNLAVLATEFKPDRADEQLLVRRAANHDVVSLAQLGLYYFKLNDFAKAEGALIEALSVYFPAETGKAPTLQGATNGTVEPHAYSDLSYDQAAVFKHFFHRTARLNEFVGTRYCRYGKEQRVGRQGALLRHNVYPDYRIVVGELYTRLLTEQDRKLELRLFESRALIPELPSCAQWEFDNSAQYIESVGRVLKSHWFCPPNLGEGCVIASVRINKQGIMSLACDEPQTDNANLQSVHDSVIDLARFALLPAPPADWNENEELTIVFDPSKLNSAPFGLSGITRY